MLERGPTAFSRMKDENQYRKLLRAHRRLRQKLREVDCKLQRSSSMREEDPGDPPDELLDQPEVEER
jgi:hypothetical protein